MHKKHSLHALNIKITIVNLVENHKKNIFLHDLYNDELYSLFAGRKVPLFLPWEKSIANSNFYVNYTPLGEKA
jgi:hypothetical protein